MLARVIMSGFLAAAVAILIPVAQAAITIDVVPVGNTGNIADTAAHSRNPNGQGAVPYAYNIGKYEVTAGQYTAFLNAVAGVDTYSLYDTSMSHTMNGSGIARSGGGTVGNPYTYTVDTAFTNRPVYTVSFGDAARFANWLANGQPTGAQNLATTEDGSYYLNGNNGTALIGVTRKPGATWVIPTEDEWYKAAYHKNDGNTANYFTYATSSDTAPGRDLADPSPGNNANYGGDPYPIQSPYYITIAGQFQNSPSPYGTFDQSGNVWEWNESIAYYPWRGVRGGAFNTSVGNLASTARGSGPFPGVGFRVAFVPEPGSIALAVMGGVCLLAYAWRRRQC